MICHKEKCTGCYACYNICKSNAISMYEDEYGAVYPRINKKKCVNCNLCRKICPQLNNNIVFKEPIETYAAYSKNSLIRKNSSSGGFATILGIQIIKNGGVVYGAANKFNEDKFKFIRIDDVSELYKIQGSKYVHCYILDCYKQIKNDLNNNKQVLFIGTPCQVSGLKAFLIEEYENLLTVDIICHGVPTQKLLFENLENYGLKKEEYEIVRFRDDLGYNLKLYKNYNDFIKDNYILKRIANLDFYCDNFLKGNIFRENCYNCDYAGKNRISDITIGDYWGLDKNCDLYDDELLGISVIINYTKKGEKWFEKCNKKLNYCKRSIDEAIKKNKQLCSPMEKSKEYYWFYNNYTKLGFKKVRNKMMPFINIIKSNKFIYSIYSKIKKF